MQAIRTELATAVQRLRDELALYDVLAADLKDRYASNEAILRDYDRRARRMVYANTIVGSYGLLEQTVDSILIVVAESYERLCFSFGELPEQVRSNHWDLTLQCLRDGDRSRIRGVVSKESALSALGRDTKEPAVLLAEAFTLSSANYRLPYIQTLFNRLAVNIDDGLADGGPEAALERTGFASYGSFLEQFVQRRNDLAHSYKDEGLLEPDLLSAYIDLTSACLNSVARVANLHIINLLATKHLRSIGTVVRTWTGRLGITMDNGAIASGDQLLLLKDGWCTSHKVLSLQSDNASLAHVQVLDYPIDVAAAVRTVPNSAVNAVSYVIPAEWRDFWPPDEKYA
jgi:hypothetical protein